MLVSALWNWYLQILNVSLNGFLCLLNKIYYLLWISRHYYDVILSFLLIKFIKQFLTETNLLFSITLNPLDVQNVDNVKLAHSFYKDLLLTYELLRADKKKTENEPTHLPMLGCLTLILTVTFSLVPWIDSG